MAEEKVGLFHEVGNIFEQHVAVEMRECVGRKTFKALLKDSVSKWEQQRKISVSIKFPAEFAHLAEIAVQEGFRLLDSSRDFLLLTKQFDSGIGFLSYSTRNKLVEEYWRQSFRMDEGLIASVSPSAILESIATEVQHEALVMPSLVDYYSSPYSVAKWPLEAATLLDYSNDYEVPEFFNLLVADNKRVADIVSYYPKQKTTASWTRDAFLVDGPALMAEKFQDFVPTGSVRWGVKHSECHGPAPGSGMSYACSWEPKAAVSQTRDGLPAHGSALVAGTCGNTAGSSMELQRKNLFWGICLIRQKPCTFLIDNGCSSNLIRESLIEELNLSWAHLPSPTSMELMNRNHVQISREARVPFAMHDYADCMMCIAFTNPPADLVLGRQWSYDVRAMHDGFANEYKFQKNGIDITLYPLTPSEVGELRDNFNGR